MHKVSVNQVRPKSKFQIISDYNILNITSNNIYIIFENFRRYRILQTPHVVPREFEIISFITICSTGNDESPLSPIINDFDPS